MHRDFLRNFTVNGQPLPKEVIDAIMDENGRDIAAAKANAGANGGSDGKMFTQEEVNRIVSERLNKERGKTNNGLKDDERAQLQGEIDRLTGELTAKDAAHKQQLADLAFDHTLDAAIKEAKGRDVKAVRSMLDIDALKGSEDHGAAIKAALDGLQKGSSWLFDADPLPPRLAVGTGTAPIYGNSIFADAFKPPQI